MVVVDKEVDEKANKVVQKFDEVEEEDKERRWMGGWRVTLQWRRTWRYWLSVWVTRLQHLNGAKRPEYYRWVGGGHGALLKSV